MSRSRNHLEAQLQKNCVNWFDFQYPDKRLLLHHSPNGGYRNSIEGALFKAMGTRAGFPDLILLEPHGGHPFLAIEMKSGKGRQTEYQKQYEAILKKVGAEYFVVRSLDEFIKIINDYLKQ